MQYDKTKHRDVKSAYLFSDVCISLHWETKNGFSVFVLLTIKNKKLFLTNTVDELVRRTGYSHTQFCRLFKRYFNTTFSQYLTDYKLDYSLGLLADKSKSILEISSHLGYDSTSYYITAFKKRFGVTPHRYRISRL